jgi:hypothetical protein
MIVKDNRQCPNKIYMILYLNWLIYGLRMQKKKSIEKNKIFLNKIKFNLKILFL